MAEININYPDKCTDKEIKKLISGYQKEIYDQRGHINSVLQMIPLIQAGLLEMQGRQNKKITYLSLFIGGMSLVVAAVALFITIDSGRMNSILNNALINSTNNLNQTSLDQINTLNKTNGMLTEIKDIANDSKLNIENLNNKLKK